MSLLNTNTTADIYRNANSPPSTPDVAGIRGLLQPDYAGGRRAHTNDPSKAWTHVLMVDLSTDIRDGWLTGVPLQAGLFDKVYIPDQNGTLFSVVFVERVGWDTPQDCKRVYLRREQVSYPTNEV
jgi:hypothetical protein